MSSNSHGPRPSSSSNGSSFDAFSKVDDLVSKPILGSDGAASWQAFRKDIPSTAIHKQSVAPKAPLKKNDRLGTGFSSWEEERKHEQTVRKKAGHAEAGSGYTTFRKKNDAEEAAERKRKIQVEKRIRPDDQEYFIPAKSFQGWKFDYIYTTRADRGGTGYYWDGHDSIKKLNGTLKGEPPSAAAEEDSSAKQDDNTTASSDALEKPKKKKRKKAATKAPVFVSDPNNPMEQAQALWQRQRNSMAVAATTASLPAGWEAAQDVTSGKTYYFHRASGERSWEIPKQPSNDEATKKAEEDEQALPEGWKSAVDATSGKTYYYNASGETKWEKPS